MRGVDKEALVHECLVEHYEKYYRIAYSYTFQEQDALDIVQEGAYRAILKSDSLKNPEYADTWICRIMMNEAVRYLEKYRGKTVALDEVPEEGVSDEPEDLDLQQALLKLNEEERRIVVLKYFEEEKLQTIAQVMDLKVSTVKSRLYRAVEKLKKYMESGGSSNESKRNKKESKETESVPLYRQRGSGVCPDADSAQYEPDGSGSHAANPGIGRFLQGGDNPGIPGG